MPDEQTVTTSTRLWSEEVAIAEANSPLADLDKTKEPGYVMSNGRQFSTPADPYAPD